MTSAPVFLRPGRDGVIVEVHVQPGARSAGITGVHDSALRIAVREKAQQGAANDALCSSLARVLGVPPSSVHVISGHRSRRKRLSVQGLDVDTVALRLQTVLGVDETPDSPS